MGCAGTLGCANLIITGAAKETAAIKNINAGRQSKADNFFMFASYVIEDRLKENLSG
jgi:hypothetical protein